MKESNLYQEPGDLVQGQVLGANSVHGVLEKHHHGFAQLL
jgi:hypothetical protein